MYARTTILRADPAHLDEGVTYVRDEILPAITRMDGCAGMSMLVNRESGRCVVTTAWNSEAARDNSLEQVRPLRESAEQRFSSGPSEIYQWEVAAVHRDHPVPEGAGCRLTWVKAAEMANIDRMVDTYKMRVLPQIQEFDGFCSASFLIDRASGRGVGTLIFDRRDQLEATRDSAARIRERSVKEMGAVVEDVEEMEVAFAHLHVPELV